MHNVNAYRYTRSRADAVDQNMTDMITGYILQQVDFGNNYPVHKQNLKDETRDIVRDWVSRNPNASYYDICVFVNNCVYDLREELDETV